MMPQTLLLLNLSILIYCSYYDWKTQTIKLSNLIIIFDIGLLYTIQNQILIGTLITSTIILGMIFLIPCIFSLGSGDFILLLGLGFFFTTQDQLNLFLGIFLITGLIYSIVYIKLYTKTKKILHQDYPLVPAIMISFLMFTILIFLKQFFHLQF